MKINKKTIICEVPVELLFSDLDIFSSGRGKNIENCTPNWTKQHYKYCDISIFRLTQHFSLLKFFMGISTKFPNDYLEWWKNLYYTRELELPMSTQDFLYKKYEEFRLMEKNFILQTDFFDRVVPKVKYNKNGYFNILDGHHRIVFLILHGLRRIKVEVDLQEYVSYLNIDKVLIVEELFEQQNRELIYTPILNLAFYDIPSERDEIYPTRLDCILEFLGSINLSNYRIIDVGSNLGFYSRHFTREKAKVVGLEPFKDHYTLAKALNGLERTTFDLRNEYFENIGDEKFDIGIILTVFYHSINDNQKSEQFLKKINSNIEKFLFWETGDDIEREKELIHKKTKFKYYKKLKITFGTGKIRELGVFSTYPIH